MPHATLYESTRFGALEIEPEGEIHFPNGLIGLGGSRYALVAREEDAAFLWLHSLEDPALAIPVCNPWAFFSDYEVEIGDAEADRLGLDSVDSADVWVTVRAGASLGEFCANLRAPIVVSEGRGFQVINEAEHAPVRMPLFEAETDDAVAVGS